MIPDELQTIQAQLHNKESVRSETVRTFLSWFGAARRGVYIVRGIRNALRDCGVRTEPDFESAYIDGSIDFFLAPAPATNVTATEIPAANGADLSAPPANSTTGAFADPTYRISKLSSANRVPTSVTPDCSLREATTIMLANDYSQLPIMQNERIVRGCVSWTSIGARLAVTSPPLLVRECMEVAHEISADASLFAAIGMIVEHQYVLVRGRENRITGIVTTSDLSLQFQQLAEPFLLLSEIENHIRRLIDGRFSKAELREAKNPSDESREVNTVADLNFGEYLKLLEQPSNWSRVAAGIDKVVFTRELDRIRTIRNDVMHFDPDGIGEDDLVALRKFVRFLQTLRSLGAT